MCRLMQMYLAYTLLVFDGYSFGHNPRSSGYIISYVLLIYVWTGHKKKVEIDEEMLTEVISVDTMKTQMEKTIQLLKDDYIKNLSLRSTTGMFISKE